MMVLAAILAVLVFTDVVEVWMILVLAFLLGDRQRGRHAGPPGVRDRDGRARGHRQRGRPQLGDVQRRPRRRPGRSPGWRSARSASALPSRINAVSFLAVIVGSAPDGRRGAPRSPNRIARPDSARRGRRATSARACATSAQTPIVLLAVVDRRRRGHGRHELQRPHPGLRPGRPAERRRRLRLPDGRVGRRLAAGGGPARLRWTPACRSAWRRVRSSSGWRRSRWP